MNAKFIETHYEYSDTIELQGSRDKIRGYLRKGYRVKDERNGYFARFHRKKR